MQEYYCYSTDLVTSIPHPTLDQFNELKTLQFGASNNRSLDSYFMFYLLNPVDPVSVVWLNHGFLHLHPGTSRYIGVGLRPGPLQLLPARLVTDQPLDVPWEGFRNIQLQDTLTAPNASTWEWDKRTQDPVLQWALQGTHRVEQDFKHYRNNLVLAMLGERKWEIRINHRQTFTLNNLGRGDVTVLDINNYTGIYAAIRSLFSSVVAKHRVLDNTLSWQELAAHAQELLSYTAHTPSRCFE